MSFHSAALNGRSYFRECFIDNDMSSLLDNTVAGSSMMSTKLALVSELSVAHNVSASLTVTVERCEGACRSIRGPWRSVR